MHKNLSERLNDSLSDAIFSECGKYRYVLWRIWDKSLPKVMCIGLNPSTANANKNDNTINVLSSMLKQLGFGGFYMTNLFGWISSKPDDLLTVKDPVGENDYYLEMVRIECEDTIVCWGSFKQATDRIAQVVHRFPNAKCFGRNKNGTPFHPRAMSYAGLLHSPKLQLYVAT